MNPSFVVYAPGETKAYGRLNVVSQLLHHIERIFDINTILFKYSNTHFK